MRLVKTQDQIISWYGYVVGDRLPPDLLSDAYRTLAGPPVIDEEIQTLLALLGLAVTTVGTHYMVIRDGVFIGSIDIDAPVCAWRVYLTQLADQFAGVTGVTGCDG